jgi:hypothetical protein
MEKKLKKKTRGEVKQEDQDRRESSQEDRRDGPQDLEFLSIFSNQV